MTETNKLGILIEKIQPNQVLFEILSELDYIRENTDYDLVFFTDEVSALPVKLNYPTFNVADAYFYDGTVIANDVASANKLRHFSNKRQYFYIHNLEWLYIAERRFKQVYDIYNEVDLIVPSESYNNLLSKYWVKPKHILPRFSIRNLLS